MHARISTSTMAYVAMALVAVLLTACGGGGGGGGGQAVIHELSITKTGTGTGVVTSAPAGVDCGSTCNADFDEATVVTLTATASTDSAFAGWGGACSGMAAAVTVTMSAARTCIASFNTSSSTGLSRDGYHVVALAGNEAATAATIRFADGVAETASPNALYAVNVSNGTGHEIGAAGEWRQLELPIAPTVATRNKYGADLFESAYEPATGLIRDYRVRISTFARGNRLYKVDHVSANASPVPELWGSVTTEDVCRSTVPVHSRSSDIADISDYWIFRSPGSDGRCNSADDAFRALSFNAGATDGAVTLAGTPIVAIHDRARRRTGYILQNGSNVVRVGKDFGNPTAFLSLPAFTSVRATLGLLGSETPRFWLFTVSAPIRVFAYDLVNGGAPVELASLLAGESAGPLDMVTEDGVAYVRLTNLASRTIRVLRIDDKLSTQVLTTVSPGTLISPWEALEPMRVTLNRVVLATSAGLYSVPKSGGAPLLISSATNPFLSTAAGSFGFMTAGTNVWYPSVQSVTSSSKLAVVREDGSDPETIDLALWAGSGADFLRPMLPAACTRECRHAALTLNVGALTAVATNAGSEIVTYGGTTRAVIATHGRYPSTPALAFGTLVSTPQQLGQHGLANSFSPAGFGLFLYSSDFPGLSGVQLN